MSNCPKEYANFPQSTSLENQRPKYWNAACWFLTSLMKRAEVNTPMQSPSCYSKHPHKPPKLLNSKLILKSMPPSIHHFSLQPLRQFRAVGIAFCSQSSRTFLFPAQTHIFNFQDHHLHLKISFLITANLIAFASASPDHSTS